MEEKKVGRPRKWGSAADRQAAYRARREDRFDALLVALGRARAAGDMLAAQVYTGRRWDTLEALIEHFERVAWDAGRSEREIGFRPL